ncbi:hypothetical protein HK096_011262, partial [Nowakowskiella sp. JEL0078]
MSKKLQALNTLLASVQLNPDDLNFSEDPLSSAGIFSEYSSEQILNIYKDNGLLEFVEKLGFSKPIIFLDTSDFFVHRMTLSDKALFDEFSPLDVHHSHLIVNEHNFLIDAFFRRRLDMPHSDIKGYQDLVRWRDSVNDSAGLELENDVIPPVSNISANSIQLNELHKRRSSFGSPITTTDIKFKSNLNKFVLEKEEAKRVLEFLDLSGILPTSLSFVCIEWVGMQNPCASFTKEHPKAPNQKYPGLGVAAKFSEVLIELSRHKSTFFIQQKIWCIMLAYLCLMFADRDGLMNFPDHFHNAYLYRKQGWIFINPAFEGYFRALCENLEQDIKRHGLSFISWAFLFGHIVDYRSVPE